MHREWSLGPRHTVMVLAGVVLLLILGLVFGLTFLGSPSSATGPSSALLPALPQSTATTAASAVPTTEPPTPTVQPTSTPTPAPVVRNEGVVKGSITLDGPASLDAGSHVLFVIDGAKHVVVKDSTAPFALRLDTRTLPNGKYTISAYSVQHGVKTLTSTSTIQVSNPKPNPKPKPEPTSRPKPSAPPTTATSLAAQQDKVIALTNADRAKAGCGPVTKSAALTRAAVKHAGFELKNQAEGHLFPGELDLGARFTAAGYTGWRSIGENAAGAPGGAWWVDADAVMHGGKATKVVNGVSTTFTSLGWMQDAAHKANILNCSFKDIGVGAVQDSSGAIWWSQDFGTKS